MGKSGGGGRVMWECLKGHHCPGGVPDLDVTDTEKDRGKGQSGGRKSQMPREAEKTGRGVE